MKKVLFLVSTLILVTGGIVFYSQKKQDTPKLEQVNVSEKKAEEKVVELEESKENEIPENVEVQKEVSKEVKESKQEVKSDPKPENKNISSVGKTESKQENKQNNSVAKEVPKETPKETSKPKESNTTTPSQSNTSSQPQNGGATTKFYESITGGKKEFASDSEANARGAEIKSKELDYVLDYNEQHPEAPIKPDINYYRVYPSVIDENGKTWYYLHFFCASGEGNDAKLKSMY